MAGAALKNPVQSFSGLEAREAVRVFARALQEEGFETPGVDARRLVAAALLAKPEDLIREPGRRVTSGEGAVVLDYLRRRLEAEPVSRILGERSFYGRRFAVSSATLDPRPCSETVIEAVLEVVRAEGLGDRPLRILDIGTGTGCLLLTLLAELPNATGVGTDIADGALTLAADNAEALGFGARVSFKKTSYLEEIADTFYILISNPPYIASAEIADLERDVRCFDPLTALDGGADGLDAYRAIASGLARVVPEGWAFFEVGHTQAAAVADVLAGALGEAARARIRVWNDLGGHQRCVAIKTLGSA